jgi:hypothetical protein
MAKGAKTTKKALRRFARATITVEQTSTGGGGGGRRDRFPRGDGDTSLRFGHVTTAITAATSQLVADWGEGQVQLHDDATGEDDGSPIDVVSQWIGLTFPLGATACLDMSYTPPKVVNAMCAEAE